MYLFSTMFRDCSKSNVGGFIVKGLYVVTRSDQVRLADERSVVSDRPESEDGRETRFRLLYNAAEHGMATGFCEKFGESSSAEAFPVIKTAFGDDQDVKTLFRRPRGDRR